MNYRAAKGATFGDEQAQVLGEFFQRFSDKNGGINPKEVLKIARDTLLYSYLEWDDTKAADKWRLGQVYNILGHIEGEITADDGTVYYHRAFYPVSISVTYGKEEPAEPITVSVYMGTKTILEDEKLRSQTLQDVLNRFRYYRNTYREFKELNTIFEAIDQTTV